MCTDFEAIKVYSFNIVWSYVIKIAQTDVKCLFANFANIKGHKLKGLSHLYRFISKKLF